MFTNVKHLETSVPAAFITYNFSIVFGNGMRNFTAFNIL